MCKVQEAQVKVYKNEVREGSMLQTCWLKIVDLYSQTGSKQVRQVILNMKYTKKLSLLDQLYLCLYIFFKSSRYSARALSGPC